jgi:hypothetical protein
VPLNANEGNAVVTAFLNAFGEDYGAMGRLVYYLRLAMPGFDWAGFLADRAANHQPFIDSGLSIDWWVTEVIRQADAIV